VTAGERGGSGTGGGPDGSAGGEEDVELPAGAEGSGGAAPSDLVGEADGPEAAEAAHVPDGPEAAEAARVVEAPDEEELVAAPAWATFILVVAPFVLGFLVIVALRWFL